jgi:hypothetical protein
MNGACIIHVGEINNNNQYISADDLNHVTEIIIFYKQSEDDETEAFAAAVRNNQNQFYQITQTNADDSFIQIKNLIQNKYKKHFFDITLASVDIEDVESENIDCNIYYPDDHLQQFKIHNITNKHIAVYHIFASVEIHNITQINNLSPDDIIQVPIDQLLDVRDYHTDTETLCVINTK